MTKKKEKRMLILAPTEKYYEKSVLHKTETNDLFKEFPI